MLLERVKNIIKSFIRSDTPVNRLLDLHVQKEISRIRNDSRYHDPRSLIPFGSKMYSQSDEDGIIQEIFNRIGTQYNTFVEFGVGDGLENNTLALLFGEWKGLWIEASPESIKKINDRYLEIIKSGKLKILESFITRENINELIDNNVSDKEIDLLSIDIDGNDYHVLNAIDCINPRVIVIEYNAKFIPPTLFCMDYDKYHRWKGGDCFGASLKFLEVNLREMGYCLVGCNLVGVNAFFVREDLVENKFLNPFTAEKHFEPARYYLGGFPSGHPATYESLARSLTMRST